MDPLSDLLRVVRLDGAYFYSVEASEPWAIEARPARELAPRVMPHAEHLISYHIVIDGRCCGGLLDEDPIELVAGDVIVFPHGDAHGMSSDPDVRTDRSIVNTTPDPFPARRRVGEEGVSTTTFFCGFLGCDRRPFNPLLASLPRRIHVRGLSNPWLSGLVHSLADESKDGRAGVDGVLTRLAEVMFIDVLRRHVEELPPQQTGWLAGLRDQTVGRALSLLHGRIDHPWTLAELARASHVSRSNLADRFVRLMGLPPMQYLAQWRMQVAANLLTETRAKVATIGERVGYDSEAAFSRAFKRATGLSPGAWRETRRATAGRLPSSGLAGMKSGL